MLFDLFQVLLFYSRFEDNTLSGVYMLFDLFQVLLFYSRFEDNNDIPMYYNIRNQNNELPIPDR